LHPEGKPLAVSGLGEFDLIDRLAALVSAPSSPRLAVDIGDDAAAWASEPNAMTVATTDALVEGVHFDLMTTSWTDLGWKALAENVSDIAAMGCQPRYAFVALGLSASAPLDGVEDLYRGMAACGQAFGCRVAGGDVVRAPCLFISVTLIGESLPSVSGRPEDGLLRRSQARPGDVIAVTGPLGGSAAGLRLLQAGWSDASTRGTDDVLAERAAVAAHRRPTPRVTVGRILVEAGVRCAIDVSDGLVADVGHICEQSHVDAALDADRIPIHPGAARRFGTEALELALSGGEDYELVGVGAETAISAASARLGQQGEAPLIVIGEIRSQAGPRPEVRVRSAEGGMVPVTRGGYRHF
jgi:thiamine-monophosphate kinase